MELNSSSSIRLYGPDVQGRMIEIESEAGSETTRLMVVRCKTFGMSMTAYAGCAIIIQIVNGIMTHPLIPSKVDVNPHFKPSEELRDALFTPLCMLAKAEKANFVKVSDYGIPWKAALVKVDDGYEFLVDYSVVEVASQECLVSYVDIDNQRAMKWVPREFADNC